MAEFDPFEVVEAADLPQQNYQPDVGGATGPTVEAAEVAPVEAVPLSRESFDPFDAYDKIQNDAARAVSEGDAQKAVRLYSLSKNFSISRLEAEEYADRLEARQRRDMARTVLAQAPGLTAFLNETPADAPIFQNDLTAMSAIEKEFERYRKGYQAEVDPYGSAPFNPYGDQRPDPLRIDPNASEIDRRNAGERTGWEKLWYGEILRGFDAGVASARQGALWDRAARGEADRYSSEFRDADSGYQATLDAASEKGTDGFLFNAAQFLGSMVGSAPEATPAATMGAATAVAAALVGSTVGAPVALTAGGLMGITATLGWYDASNRVEGGQSYRSLIQAGANERDARLISRGVGNLNAAIETGFSALGGKLAAPFARRFAARFIPKFASALEEETMGRQMLQIAKAWGLGSLSETATEVLQESVTMAGEQLAREVADADFDPATLDDVVDRLSDTAISAFKGALVLGGAGAAVGAAFGTAKVRRAHESREFFERIAQETTALESVQTAPDAVHAFIQEQASAQETATTYVDGVQFNQALIDAGISRQELEQKMPDVAAQLDAAVATGTDVEIPTADYAVKIAPTPLGARLLDHVRLAPDALSAADAIQVERAYREAQKAIVRGTFDPEHAASAESFLNRVENREWQEARRNVEIKLFKELKSAHPEFSDREVMGQAKLGALATAILTRRAGIPVMQMGQWAPTVMGAPNSAARFARKPEDGITVAEVEAYRARIQDWTSAEKIALAKGKRREEIAQLFSTKPEPIGFIPREFLSRIFNMQLADNRVYTSEAYFLDHVVNHHPEDISAADYLELQDMFQNPEEVILDKRDGKDGAIFVKRMGRTYQAVVIAEPDGRMYLYKSLNKTAKKKPYPKLDRAELSVAGRPNNVGSVSQSVHEAEAPYAGSRISSLDNLEGIVTSNAVEVKQETRGSFDVSANWILLTPNADLSTFSHELGHWYLANLLELSKLDGASASLQEDARAILKEFGLGSVQEWDALGLEGQRKYHERFAYWTEIYFATGKAPVSGLRKFFDRLGAWIRDVYRAMKGGVEGALGRAYEQEFGEALPELSPEVRRVLDRMIASDDMLDQATAANSLKPLFDEKPADMPDEVWFDMQLARDEAEMEGMRRIDEVRARDEKWMQAARSKELKKIQAQAKDIRDEVRKQVEIDVSSRPEFVALDIVSRGNRAAVTMNLKMNPDAVRELGFSEQEVEKLRELGCLKKDGLTPQQAAESIKPFARSLNTGKKLISAILRAGDKEALIERETTKRCLEKHSDFFDPKKVDKLVTKAIHTEARSRLVANELRYLAANPFGNARVYREAAKQVAMDRLARMKIGSVHVKGLVAAESRASREAYEALKNGNRAQAIAAKRRQLVCHEMIALALDVEAKVRGMSKLKSQIFAADKKLAKTRDIDIVNVARYVLTNSGAGRGDPITYDATKADGYVQKLRSYDEERAAEFQNILEKFKYRPNMRWTDLTVEEATDVLETVRGLWKMAGDAKEVLVSGKREAMEKVVGELTAQAAATHPDHYEAGAHERILPDEKLRKNLLGTANMLKRVESWCISMDGGKPGVFHRYIFRPVSEAASRFREANNDFQKKLADIVDAHPDWMKPTEIYYEFGDYVFKTKAELIGAILHTGNESNKSKMLVGGRGDDHAWYQEVVDQNGRVTYDFSAWDGWVNELYQDGTITEADMDAVQAIWDLLEETKPLAQRAYKQLWGYYFKEIEASPVVTPWKTYRGGYVPAMVDRGIVAEGDRNLAKEVLSQNDILSAMPAKRPGFSQSRVEDYKKPLSLNLSMLSSHVQKVLKFAYIAPTAQEVAKIINNRDFAGAMDAIDPTLRKDLLSPWLKRATEQTISDGNPSWISRLRSLAGMNIMAGHIVNALQQVTGLSVALAKVSHKDLAHAMATLARHPKDTVASMCLKSTFMRTRLWDRAYEYQSRVERAASGDGLEVRDVSGLYNKVVAVYSKLEPARDWIQRHAYFFQTAMQCPIDTIVWTGAYNAAVREGLSEADAVARADLAIRTTQSDFSPENIANIEAGSDLQRLFLVFYNYFGMQANLLGERWALAKATKQYGRLATDALFIVWVPAVVSAVIQRMFKDGFDTDDDEDVDFFDVFQLLVGEPLKGVTAMVPFVGSAANTAGSYMAKAGSETAQLIYGKNPYTGRIMSSPAIDLVGNAGLGLLDIYKYVTDDGSRDINARSSARHFLDLATIITGLPLGAVKNPVGFAAGVTSGQYAAGNPAEILSGMMTGKQEH